MLLEAILRGRLYQVKFLLDNKVENVNKTDENGQSCLMKAIFLSDKLSRTRYKIVRLLLKNGAKVNYVDKNNKSALMWASSLGKDELVKLILQEGILDLDLNAVDWDGNTALHLAAMQGHANIVRMLIKALKRFGLDIDRKNFSGMTPMLAAVEKGQECCAQILMTEGEASLTTRDPQSFLNTQEWAQKRSLSNLSQFIANKTPIDTPVSEGRPQSSERGNNSDDEDSVGQAPDCCSSGKLLEPDNVGERAKSQISDFKPDQQINASVDTYNIVKKKKKFNRETTSQLRRQKAPSNANNFCQSSDATMTNLFSLYAIQNSQNYRKGYDLSSLPPSGSYPEPSKSELSDEVFGIDALRSTKDLRIHNAITRRRFSTMSSLDSTGLAGRSSNIGFRKEGQFVMMVNTFSRIVPERRRRITLSQAPSLHPSLVTELDSRKSHSVTFQENSLEATDSKRKQKFVE